MEEIEQVIFWYVEGNRTGKQIMTILTGELGMNTIYHSLNYKNARTIKSG